MLDDGTYVGVLDRFEGEQAVLVLQRDGRDVADVLVARTELPEEGRHEDAVFSVELEDGDVRDLEYDPEESKSRAEQAQDRFDRLSKRPPSDEEN